MWVRVDRKLTIKWDDSLGGAIGTVGGRALGVDALILGATGTTIGRTVSGPIVPLCCFVIVFLVACCLVL